MSRKQSTDRVALSYPLSTDTPYPAGGRPARITAVSRLGRGDISNTSLVQFWNHMGTHMDGPAHMIRARALVHYCPPAGFVLGTPLVADIPADDSRLIEPEDLAPWSGRLPGCDILLIRTGFTRHRRRDPGRYAARNPGISRGLARYVVKHCPKLVCMGIDAISFAAAEHLREGIGAHRIVFRRKPPLLLIEDLNLDFDLRRMRRVVVAPFFIAGLDSCPCTVVAEIEPPRRPAQSGQRNFPRV